MEEEHKTWPSYAGEPIIKTEVIFDTRTLWAADGRHQVVQAGATQLEVTVKSGRTYRVASGTRDWVYLMKQMHKSDDPAIWSPQVSAPAVKVNPYLAEAVF